MPSGRAGITGTPSFTSAGTCAKSWEAAGFWMRGVVAGFLAGHLPGCRCYRRPMGRREPARRGLAHLLVMLREEGAVPPVTADEPPYRQLLEGYCRFLRDATSWSAAALR